MKFLINTFLVFVLFMFAPSVNAGELTGFVAGDLRAFAHNPQFVGQKDGLNASLITEPEYFHVTEDEKHTLTIRPFARVDNHDNNRTHFDLRQADWLYEDDGWELKAGVSKVFWGVTEANHLVNIINQIDAIEDVDGEDYLGQPMVQLALLKEWGTLRFFYLPYFRERTFQEAEGRLRGGTVVEASQAIYGSAAEQWHQDFALRYTHVIGDWDVGLSHFSGTGREPSFVSGTAPDGSSVFIPKYDIIDQTGVDLQYTTDAWLWKFEGITRSGQGDRLYAAGGGFEYTLFNILEEGLDLGFLLEYHWDERDASAPANIFDDDIFAGSRLVLNDEYDTEFLGGVIVDRDTKARGFTVEAARRINDNWKVELDGRVYAGMNASEPNFGFKQDDHAQVRLAYYF